MLHDITYITTLGEMRLTQAQNFITSFYFTTQDWSPNQLNNAPHSYIYYKLLRSDVKKLKLKPAGTEFQKKVWQAVQTIKFGETATYQAIANKIGQPNAVRAVANAVGNNPIALLIPCHRIVRTDGALGGYKWGIERKKWLLKYEASSVY